MSMIEGYHAVVASLSSRPPDAAVFIQWRAVVHAGPWARKRILRKIERLLASEARLRPGVLVSFLRDGKGVEVTVTGTAREVQIWAHRIEGAFASD
jgi:hypothetical protein